MVFTTQSNELKMRFENASDSNGFEIIREADLDTHLKSYDADLYVNARNGSVYLQASDSDGNTHTHLTCYDEVVDINGDANITGNLTVGGELETNRFKTFGFSGSDTFGMHWWICSFADEASSFTTNFIKINYQEKMDIFLKD